MTTNTDEHNEDEFLIGGRLVPISREGNVVYARSLRRGEEDAGQVIELKAGDRLVIPKGELVIDSRDIDDQLEEDLGGYKPISPVIYVLSALLKGSIERRKILAAIGRWMDSTHLHWKGYTEAVDGMSNARGLKGRILFHRAWASAEQAVMMLHRLNELVAIYNRKVGGIEVPSVLKRSSNTVKRLRDKIEHSDQELLDGTTVLAPMATEAGSNTLAIGYIPNGEGDSLFLDVAGIIQPLVDLRESVIDSLGFVRPSVE